MTATITARQAAAGTRGALLVGPDMDRLRRSYPSRSAASSWPSTEQSVESIVSRLLAPPFPTEPDRPATLRRRRGLTHLLSWLADEPGQSWQRRWLASGADAMGNAEWWRPLIARVRRGSVECGVSNSSNLRVCAVMLVVADVIRPSLDWMLTPRVPQTLVSLMAEARDPPGFAELAARCDASPAGRRIKTAALRRAATILAVKGGLLRDITVGDCLELSAAVDTRSVRRNAAMGFYQLLYAMGIFGPDAPSTMRVVTAHRLRHVVSPELADVFAAVIGLGSCWVGWCGRGHRVRVLAPDERDGTDRESAGRRGTRQAHRRYHCRGLRRQRFREHRDGPHSTGATAS
jgi:hypothetical protein